MRRCQARVPYRALCLLRLDCRACSVQRLAARLVRTPQTVQSLTACPCPRAVPCLTLVTLKCTPADIAMSVVEHGGLVYSPAVLRLRGQSREQFA